MSLAYLLARTADSVSDGEWLPLSERAAALRELVASLTESTALERWKSRVAPVHAADSAEAALLHHLPTALQELRALPEDDQRSVREIVRTLSEGMLVDLERFPGAVQDAAELRRHLWAAAGCVGAFWTEILRHHEPAVRRRGAVLDEVGTRLGNALQITNVLRDIPGDLREGRCYLPVSELAEVGLAPEELRDSANESRVAPVFYRWMRAGLDDFEASMQYVLEMPAWSPRLRLAALWPWAMGLKTLQLLTVPGWLAGPKRKVPRSSVYRMICLTTAIAPWTPLLRWYMRAQLSAARRSLPPL
jgi:farnesyl-diphosphate farnesyltransferase